MADPRNRRPPLSRAAVAAAAGVSLLLLAAAGSYGYFRDELYYLMCADHPAWGYVDHPPLAMVFLTAWKAIFGASQVALRVPPALLAGAAALGTALLAREMRGGAAAQALAAVVVGLMPGVLALGAFYSMNAFDVAFWIAVAWIVCRLLDPAADRRWWWALGLVFGLGLLNKYSLGFLGAGLAAGILLSPLRRDLLGRRALLGMLIGLLLVAPHVAWQASQGWPTVEFIRNAYNLKNVALSPAGFWSEQLLFGHPAFAPVWLTGLAALLVSRRLRPWRPLGVSFVVVGLWLTLSHAKPYYLVPAYPMVVAAGAVTIAGWLARRRAPAARAVAVALPVLLALFGLAIAPLTVPLLPPRTYVAYEQTLGLRPRNMEHNSVGALPQHFADRFGWEELARTVREVVVALPAAERPRTLVIADNYGECGAVNRWGLPAGVPPAVSGHNSCWGWWPADLRPEVAVLVGFSREEAERVFSSVELGAVHRNEWAMPYERELPVWVCRGWKIDPAVARAEARFAI